MFVCGYEFRMIAEAIDKGIGWDQSIHTENASRVRMLCGLKKVPCYLEMFVADDEWVHLKIPKVKRRRR